LERNINLSINANDLLGKLKSLSKDESEKNLVNNKSDNSKTKNIKKENTNNLEKISNNQSKNNLSTLSVIKKSEYKPLSNKNLDGNSIEKLKIIKKKPLDENKSIANISSIQNADNLLKLNKQRISKVSDMKIKTPDRVIKKSNLENYNFGININNPRYNNKHLQNNDFNNNPNKSMCDISKSPSFIKKRVNISNNQTPTNSKNRNSILSKNKNMNIEKQKNFTSLNDSSINIPYNFIISKNNMNSYNNIINNKSPDLKSPHLFIEKNFTNNKTNKNDTLK